MPRDGHLDVRRRSRRPARQVLRDAAAGDAQAALQFHERPARHRRHAGAVPAEDNIQRTLGLSTSFDAGRGCPYQCSFCTIINVQGRKSRFRSADDVEKLVRDELGAGHPQVLHHRRQFRPQQGLGSDLRPADRAAGEGRHPARPDDPGRHALPQDPELRRKGQARRRHARLHRAGEHQSGQSDGRQEAPEQDHRIPQDAARLEGAGHHHARRLHPRLPGRHAGDRSAATSRSSSTSCRSTSSSSSA